MNETKFDKKGKVYAKFRPTYAQEFMQYLYTQVGLNKDSVIADIGSGTGILTRQLLERGSRVFAVEPNADMRAQAEASLGEMQGFTSVEGTDMSTTLAQSSVDFITVGQAFHWFDPVGFKRECMRILKPGGKVILVWNIRSAEAKWAKDSDEINREYCPNYKGFNSGVQGVADGAVFDSFFTEGYEARIFENDHIFDLEAFLGRSLSSSYALKEGDEAYSSYVARLIECFEKNCVEGKLTIPNITESYVGLV